jgi:hypothetical protein
MTLARLAPLVLIAVLAASCGDKDKSSNQATTMHGGSVGVKGSTGQPVLTRQGSYIVVPISKLQLQ